MNAGNTLFVCKMGRLLEEFKWRKNDIWWHPEDHFLEKIKSRKRPFREMIGQSSSKELEEKCRPPPDDHTNEKAA